MALLWSDGFDRYGVSADLALNYSDITNAVYNATGGPINNGGNVQCQELTTFARLRKNSLPVVSVLTAGNGAHFSFWFKRDAAVTATTQPIVVIGNNIQNEVSGIAPQILYLASTGRFDVTDNGSGATLASSATGLITTGVWYHVEYAAKYNTGANGGYIKLWLNGINIINFQGTTNTGTVPTALVGFELRVKNVTNTRDNFFTNVIMWDENGSDFVYPQLSAGYLPIIETLSMNAANAVQWTPLASTNVSQIHDPAFEDGDTTYNRTLTPTQQDSFTLNAQAVRPFQTFGIVAKTVAKQDAAGTVKIRQLIIVGGNTFSTADITITVAYVMYFKAWGLNPNTSLFWNTSDVNSILPGYNLQSTTAPNARVTQTFIENIIGITIVTPITVINSGPGNSGNTAAATRRNDTNNGNRGGKVEKPSANRDMVFGPAFDFPDYLRWRVGEPFDFSSSIGQAGVFFWANT